jgi:hypothetical protein
MRQLRHTWKGLLVALLVTSGILIACQKDARDPSLTSAAAKKTPSAKYDPVAISCADADQSIIDLRITAGASGAPAGFSIQWMTQEALDALGGIWPASDDPSLCKASFSGKAYGNSYALAANQSIVITLGDLLAEYDNGGAIKGNNPDCEGQLACGTQYAFRAFAHADNVKNRSEFSFGVCETAQCDDGSCGRHWYGFWKTHYPDAWPQEVLDNGLDLGSPSHHYSAEELEAILLQPTNGNGLVILAHQLISARLNLAGGTNCFTDQGDALIGNKVIPPTNGSTADLKYSTINLPQLVGNLHKFSSCKLECPTTY